jgi:hypothetical protein
MCDTLCIRHGRGMWFAKSSDRHPDEAQVVEHHARRRAGGALRTQYLTIPDPGAAAFVGSRPTWLWGCEHGVNEHGVAIGNEKIWTVDDPRALPSALLGMDVVRLVLERARTADDALDIAASLLEAHGQGGSGEPFSDEPYFSSFLVVDAEGGWTIETSNRTWVARPVGEGASISNRVSIRTDWLRASADVAPGTDFDAFRDTRWPTDHADDRLRVTGACVARGAEVTAADLARTLRDHAETSSTFTVCMHRREFHAQTTASMIVDLPGDGAPVRAWACLGNPCVSVFVPCFPPHVPAPLADPAQWARFARLRDEYERKERTLDEIRSVLQPVEDELWAAADAAYASGTDACRRLAATAYDRVDEALRRLGT